MSRNYHNVTAKYNGFFNARNMIKEGEKKLATAHVDNYDRTLAVFRYADAQKAKNIFPEMDTAIKKLSIVIQRHSIFIKNEEYCAWIDDSYLQMGMANFYKHDFFSALEIFQFISTRYKKKPIRFDALLWTMKTQLELGRVREAENLFDFLTNDEKFPSRLKGHFAAVAAHMFLQSGNLPKGIEQLESAARVTRKKSVRARYHFILAQLYNTNVQFDKSFVEYGKVIKLNPPYDMAFNAMINQARTFDPEGKDSKAIKASLLKMVRDSKNKEFLDQIYFALAGIAIKQNDVPQAIEYLKLSVAKSETNNRQKALSCLELARIYFDQPDYKLSQVYYDSTVTFMSPDHPDFKKIENTRNSLTLVVKNLNIIELEDSLQNIAKLSPKEREKFIDGIVEAEMAAEKKKRDEEAALKLKEQQQQNEALFSSQNQSNPGPGNPGSGESSWYFYNPTTVSFGYTEFVKRFGNRKLEDNWRRSNKGSLATHTDPEEEEEDGDTLKSGQPKPLRNNKEKYLKALPVTQAMVDKSNERIVSAYYNLGIIYREQLDRNREAAKYFEELQVRFPANEYALTVYYHLYLIYSSLFDQEKALIYKNILLSKYPDSEFARVINNPEKPGNKSLQLNRLKSYYEETYKAYNDKKYLEVISRKASSDTMFPYNDLTPKFDYLKTLSIGKTRDLNTFEASLRAIIVNYPSDPVKVQAQEILSYIESLKGTSQQSSGSQNGQNEPSPYEHLPATEQIFCVTFPNNSHLDINSLKASFSNYNTTYFSLRNLAIASSFLDENTQILTVRGFKDVVEALDYYEGMNGNVSVFDEKDLAVIRMFVIAVSNLPVLYQRKDVAAYHTFFMQKYIQ